MKKCTKNHSLMCKYHQKGKIATEDKFGRIVTK